MTDPIARLNAALEGRYAIERELGEGGMATVYLADDLKHNRKVALKVLNPQVGHELGVERFLREIRIAASLSHPNILPLFDSGEADGLLYFVMPYVEGETLRHRLARERRLPVEDVVRLVSEIGEALARAHEAGLVHRDIKPENILLESGHALVADFGVARAVHVAGGDRLTRTGLAVGTPAYMSPEQAAGEALEDARSDIYSLACLAYEMLAGEPPFTGSSAQVVVAGHLARAVPPLRERRSDVPPGVERAIERALSKQPADRFATATELAGALTEAITAEARVAEERRTVRRRWTRSLVSAAAVAAVSVGGWSLFSQLGAPAIERIAVLPASNLTRDPEQDYFVDGVHEALVTELQRSGIPTIARQAVLQYRDTEKTVREIARELGVDALIQPSVGRVRDSVVIDVSLIGGRSQMPLWTRSFDSSIEGVLGLYRDVTRRIADEVGAVLSAEARARLAERPAVDPQAYDANLKGQFHLGRQSSSDLDAALQYFDLALEIDPSYALAYVGIAQVWSRRQLFGIVPPDEARQRVKAAAQQAIQLDNTLVEAQHRLASIRTWDEWDWEGGEAGYQRVIQLNPNYPAARRGYASLLEILGRPDEAMVQIKRALELDPFNEGFQGDYGAMLIRAGRYDEGIVQIQNALKTAPNAPGLHGPLRNAFLAKGMNEEALAEWKWLFFAPGERGLAEAMDRGYAEGGFREAVRRTAEMWAARSDTIYVPPHGVAALFAAAGEHDRAIDWLERGVQIRNTNIPGAISIGPIFDSLRDDPRFQDLRRRINLPR